MKKWMMMLAIVLSGTALLAQAKGRKGPCEKLESTKQWMKDSLSLKPEQLTKIEALHTEACTKFETARQETAGNKDLLKEKNKAIMAELRTGYKGILTEDQVSKLKLHLKQGRGHEKHKGGARPTAEARADSLTQKLVQELELTTTQIPLVKAQNLSLMNHRDEMRELKRAGADTQVIREKHRTFMAEYKSNMKEILTDSQERKFKEWHKSQKGKKGSDAKTEEE